MVFPYEKSHQSVPSELASSIGGSSSLQQVAEPHLSHLKQDGARKMVQENYSIQLTQQQHYQSLFHVSPTSGSRDSRVVLPKANLDANNSIPHRRVIPPQGKSDAAMAGSAESDSQQLNSSDSKLRQTLAYKEQMEFLTLKLRYMQNDIEFKKNQIDSSRAACPTTSSSSILQNRKRSHRFVQQQAVSASNFCSASHGKTCPVSAATRTKAQHFYSKSNMPIKGLGHLSTSSHTVATSNSNSVKYVWSSQQSLDTRKREARAADVGKACDYEKGMSDSGGQPLRKQGSNICDPVQITRLGKSSPSVTAVKDTNIKPVSARTVLPPSSQLIATADTRTSSAAGITGIPAAGTTNTSVSSVSPASTVERLGSRQPSEIIHKSIHGAQDKRYVLNPPSSSSAPVVAVPSNLTWRSRQTVLSSTDINLQVSSNKTVSAISAVNSSFISSIGAHGHNHHHLNVPSNLTWFSSQTVPSSTDTNFHVSSNKTVSSLSAVDSSFIPSPTAHEHNHHHHPNERLSELSSVSLSKYKLIKCPTNVQANNPSPTLSRGESTAVHSSFKDSLIAKDSPSSIIPTKAAPMIRRSSQGSRLSLRSPNLKIQTAAKLVSKYKLMRLSPTSAQQAAPPLFYSQSQFKKSFIIDKEDNKIASQHKLGDRYLSSGSPIPDSSSKKVFHTAHISHCGRLNRNSQPDELNRKHKLDRLPVLNSHSVIIRHSPQLLHDAPPNKRAKTEDPFFEKQSGHEIRSEHKLDRRNIRNALVKLKVSPEQAGTFGQLWVDSKPFCAVRDRESTRIKSSSSVYKWKRTSPVLQSKSSRLLMLAHNSRFKWSRLSVQAHNIAWQQRRQKLRLLLVKKYRHFRLTKSAPLASESNVFSKSIKFRDSKTNLVMIDGVVYKSSRLKLTRARRLSSGSTASKAAFVQKKEPEGLKNIGTQKTKLISVRGIHFTVDHSGKKLCRAQLFAHDTPLSSKPFTSDMSSGNYASRAVLRSIAITAAKYKRNHKKAKAEAQHCIFFGRFGRCHRGDKCPYIHDPDKVAVCTRFLRGKCDTTNCPFSHKASVNKMPVCLFYFKGSCSRENCPYLHVRVNPNAPVCRDFRNGFCSLGVKCKNIHSHVCPSFAVTGKCSRAGKCTMLHRLSKRDQEGVQPQRKPLNTSSAEQQQQQQHGGWKMLSARVSSSSNHDTTSSQKSVLTPIVSAYLPVQPAFISLETSYVPSFICQKMNQKLINGKNTQTQPQVGGPGQAVSKEKPSHLVTAESGTTLDKLLDIRPSFLTRMNISACKEV